MDIFCEHIVKRKKQNIDRVLEMILIFVAMYMSILVFGMMMILKSFTLLIIAGIWYGAIYLIRRKDIEYNVKNQIFLVWRNKPLEYLDKFFHEVYKLKSIPLVGVARRMLMLGF